MRNGALQTTNHVALIDALQAGDEHALRQLHEMFYKPICYLAFTLVHNRQDAEDIAVEAFMKVWNKRKDFDSLYAVKSYLNTVTRNACLNIIRNRKRRSTNEEALLLTMNPNEDYIFNKVVDAELHAEVLRQIERLPQKPRRVLKEVFVNGKKVTEISKDLSMPVKNVHNNKWRGIFELREYFSKNGTLPAAATVAYLLMGLYSSGLISRIALHFC